MWLQYTSSTNYTIYMQAHSSCPAISPPWRHIRFLRSLSISGVLIHIQRTLAFECKFAQLLNNYPLRFQVVNVAKFRCCLIGCILARGLSEELAQLIYWVAACKDGCSSYLRQVLHLLKLRTQCVQIQRNEYLYKYVFGFFFPPLFFYFFYDCLYFFLSFSDFFLTPNFLSFCSYISSCKLMHNSFLPFIQLS